MSFFGQPQQQATGGGLFSSPLGNKTAGGLFGGTTSAFPTTTTTGAATSTMFGGVQQPQASTSGSLFGPKPAGTSMFGAAATTQQPSGGLFGQQPQQQQPTATGGFTSAASGGLFGGAKPATSAFGQVSQPTMFGQQAQQQPTIGGGGLFGTAAPAAGAFGTTTTSTPSLFGTGTAPSIGTFGQQQQPQQTQQSVGGGLFGGAQSAAQPTFATFGAGGQTGTNVVKFAPPTGGDTMQLKGTQQQVTTKQMCISGMKEYESKSIEELRVGDYLAGRKVNMNALQAVGAAGTSMFGQPQQQQQTNGGGLFGKPEIFGGTTSAFPTTTTTGTATSTMFGGVQQPQASTSGSLFGQQPQPAAISAFGTGG